MSSDPNDWDKPQGNESSQDPGKKTKTQRIREAEVPTLMKVIRIINSIVAACLIVSGILAFSSMTSKDDKSANLDLSKAFSAIYIILFASLLIVFEMHCCSRIDVYLFTYFGFMYSITGRFMFFLFIGTLGFALDIFGIVMGIITIVVVFGNAWVIHNNRAYVEHLRQKNIASRLEAEKMVLSKSGGTEMTTSSGGSSGGSKKPPTGDDWERMYDDEADSYYYYNNKTKETRWDQSGL